jgi:hypothetical protein
VNGCAVHWFSLVCSAKALTERLTLDVESGVRKDDIIERSIARIPLYKSIGSVNIDVASEASAQIAEQVRC